MNERLVSELKLGAWVIGGCLIFTALVFPWLLRNSMMPLLAVPIGVVLATIALFLRGEHRTRD